MDIEVTTSGDGRYYLQMEGRSYRVILGLDGEPTDIFTLKDFRKDGLVVNYWAEIWNCQAGRGPGKITKRVMTALRNFQGRGPQMRLADLKPGAINVDDYSVDAADLHRLAKMLMNYPVQAGNILFTRRRGATAATFNIGCYADLKAQAMVYRKSGNVALAMRLETDAQRIYENLPDFARW